MKILLTNDDGYRAAGIVAMAEALAARGHTVTIVAPERQRSAASHAVTLHKPLRLMHSARRDRENIKFYFTNGTPADSAMLGLLEVQTDSDLLISGINSGPNLGEDVIYSGTVGAAVEGALIGVRSIAVSLCEYGKEYELAAFFTAGLAERIADADLPGKVVLNVNVPPGKASDYRGFRVVRLGNRKYKDVIQKRQDPRGFDYYWIAGAIIRDGNQENTDVYAVSRGLISVTPLTLDFTDDSIISGLNLEDPMELNKGDI